MNRFCNRFLFLVLRPWMSDGMINLSLKYDGARPLRHQKAIAASLNLTHWEPVQLFQSWRHKIVFLNVSYQACGKVLHVM